MQSIARHALRALPCGLGLLAAALLWSPGGEAFVMTGESLGLDQRGFRVHDNFTDPMVTSQTAQHPQFPGASGAALAIWKAVAEWGSDLHGDGTGDPHQPFGLGSGASNFDAQYIGLAPDPGGPDDNVFSQIDGSNLGIVAFTETPVGDGWRIRFYRDPWDWHASPANIAFGGLMSRDLQGVATHEYGHALGLGHSSVATSTMVGTVNDFALSLRSLDADDVAGVQAIYGAVSPAKPRIETYDVAAGVLTITGSGFSAIGNEVRFPRATPATISAPLSVGSLPSTQGGTRITVPIPAGVGTGDLLVRRDGVSFDALSNAFPFDPNAAPCPTPVVYGSSKLTSLGTLPDIYPLGSPSQSIDDFTINCDNGIPGASGVLFFGGDPAQISTLGGTLWAAPPLRRHSSFTFDFLGQVTISVPVEDFMLGQTHHYQLWFEDAQDPFGAGLSNGLEVRFCP